VKACVEIHEVFQRQFAEGRLAGWNAGKYRKYQTLDLSNRYFTPKRDAPDMEHIPFTKDVDPRGILEKMAMAGYVHGEEN
jgi:hypothetical protein